MYAGCPAPSWLVAPAEDRCDRRGRHQNRAKLLPPFLTIDNLACMLISENVPSKLSGPVGRGRAGGQADLADG